MTCFLSRIGHQHHQHQIAVEVAPIAACNRVSSAPAARPHLPYVFITPIDCIDSSPHQHQHRQCWASLRRFPRAVRSSRGVRGTGAPLRLHQRRHRIIDTGHAWSRTLTPPTGGVGGRRRSSLALALLSSFHPRISRAVFPASVFVSSTPAVSPSCQLLTQSTSINPVYITLIGQRFLLPNRVCVSPTLPATATATATTDTRDPAEGPSASIASLSIYHYCGAILDAYTYTEYEYTLGRTGYKYGGPMEIGECASRYSDIARARRR